MIEGERPTYAPPQPDRRGVLGVTSLCLGLGGLVVALGPALLVMFGAALGVAGVVTGATAKSRGEQGGMGVWGMVSGVVAVLLGVAFV